jgi:hypothetical protein
MGNVDIHVCVWEVWVEVAAGADWMSHSRRPPRGIC